MKVSEEVAALSRGRWYVAVGLAVALVPLGGIGYLVDRQAEDGLLHEYTIRLDGLAVEHRQVLNLLVRQRQEALSALAQMGALPAFAAELAEAARDLRSDRQGTGQATGLPVARRLFDGVLILNGEGTVRRSAGTLAAWPAGRLAEDLARARQGPWARFQGGAGEPPSLLIGLPLVAGEVVFVRSAIEDVERLLSNRRTLGESGESFVADREGRPVVPALRHPGQAGEPITTGAMQRCLKGDTNAFTIEPDYKGILTAMAYQPLPELGGGCLMVHVAADEIMSSTRALRNKMLLLIGLAALVLAPIGMAVGRSVGLKTEASLQRTGAELDRQVRERTVQLEEANRSLQEEISVRRKAEEALQETNLQLARHAVELTTANKELDAFSYSVSHDLRAPLRSLDGFSLALLEDCSDRLDDKGKDHLNRIRASSQRMGQLIDDLLELARMSRRKLHRQPVNVSDLAQAAAADLRKAWPNRQVELRVASGLMADADPPLFQKLMDHVLGNAWKFTSKREQAVIEVGAARRDGETVYFVRDNGAGFDMAYAGKLFGAFQRLHAMTEFPGTGIGLAAVQRIVHRHGGRVWAEGKVGEGATLYFTLGEQAS